MATLAQASWFGTMTRGCSSSIEPITLWKPLRLACVVPSSRNFSSHGWPSADSQFAERISTRLERSPYRERGNSRCAERFRKEYRRYIPCLAREATAWVQRRDGFPVGSPAGVFECPERLASRRPNESVNWKYFVASP